MIHFLDLTIHNAWLDYNQGYIRVKMREHLLREFGQVMRQDEKLIKGYLGVSRCGAGPHTTQGPSVPFLMI